MERGVAGTRGFPACAGGRASDLAPNLLKQLLILSAAYNSLPTTRMNNAFEDRYVGIRCFQPDDAVNVHAAARESYQGALLLDSVACDASLP